jgi:hypothetical protein
VQGKRCAEHRHREGPAGDAADQGEDFEPDGEAEEKERGEDKDHSGTLRTNEIPRLESLYAIDSGPQTYPVAAPVHPRAYRRASW